MSNFTPATRQAVKPTIALVAESGSGKTMSALLLARGLAGPDGKIAIIDTESGRGQLYADVIPNGYDAMELQAPFTPERYTEAIHAAQSEGYACVVIDSTSHEWEGAGGVCDQAAESEERTRKAGLHNWRKPKLAHAKFVQAFMRSTIPIIFCIRGKYKSRQTKGPDGKAVIIKDDYLSPIQADDFIFEMTAHAIINPDHTIVLTKCSHPDLRDCFPKDGKEPLSIEHGERIAVWASSGAGPRPQQPAGDGNAELRRLKADLWKRAKGKFADLTEFEQALWENDIMDPNTETLSTLGIDRLRVVSERAKEKLGV